MPMTFTNKARSQKLHSDDKVQKTQYALNAFRQFDKDQSGFLDERELSDALGPRGMNLDMTRTKLKDLFAHMDRDRNGLIDFKELAVGRAAR